MKVNLTQSYINDFKKLPVKIQLKAKQQILKLAQNIRHPSIRARKMVNQKNTWEGRIDQSYRFTFKIEDNTLVFRRIGTHEIYRKP